MKVFGFDLLAYGKQLEHLKVGNELLYPLARKHFEPDVAMRTYAEHLQAWEDGPSRLRWGRVQRASLLPLRADEFSRSDGLRRRATDKEAETADLRQPAAAARAAAACRGTCHARLSVGRAARF
jgi:hypothetical protein